MFVKDMSADFFSEVINVMVKYVDGGFFLLLLFFAFFCSMRNGSLAGLN